ncbi:MAG TPA: hypothetical protein VEC99_12685 [Clostridia bacterium]|nr:hypothetical protein [Clostridia bacterium]
MPKVKIESLREGMVVAADVKNMDNMLLLPSGCVITEKHIHILSAWGITEVQVQDCGDTEAAEDILKRLPPEVLNKLTNELQRIFWEPIDKNPIQAETFNLALRRKARQTRTSAS